MIHRAFGSLCVVCATCVTVCVASPWRPARGPLPASLPRTPTNAEPIVTLGLPIGSPVARARPDDDPLVATPGVGVAPAVPMLGDPVEMTAEERYNHGLVDLSPSGKTTAALDKPLAADQPVTTAKPRPASVDNGGNDLVQESHFGEFFNRQFQGLTEGRPWFQSDHCFDRMISPVTNPFLFEDPRTLTEIRPIFMYQSIPTNNPWFNGGSALFVGTQARLTLIPNRFSVTLNKLGGTGLFPASSSPMPDEFGFSEVWLGPKVTFWRGEDTGTVAAAGMIFQIPMKGSSNVYQNTGDLSYVPYVSVAQHIPTAIGRFNIMDTAGFAVSSNSQRSDYFYNSFHIDYDIIGRFYPFLEFNWFQYTSSGQFTPFNFEGRDLVNFGGNKTAGRGLLTIAPGLRYKFSESLMAGGAVEFPIAGQRDLLDFRLTLDLIWRY